MISKTVVSNGGSLHFWKANKMQFDDGGSAYPIPDVPVGDVSGNWLGQYRPTSDGETLLDRFAGLAMQALIQRYGYSDEYGMPFANAERAYNMAEAMVKQKRLRESNGQKETGSSQRSDAVQDSNQRVHS